MQNRLVLRSILFALLAYLPAHGQNRYLLETEPSDAVRLISENSLQLVRQIERRPVYVVAAPAGTSSGELAERIRRSSGVRNFEPDREVKVSEAASQNGLQATAESLARIAASRTFVDYFGAASREIYVQQPAAILVHLGEAHQRYGLGPTVVAVIDTGVDPMHPALRRVLQSGYDFVTDREGTPSELSDVDPLTRAALTQSTVAILDGRSGMTKVNPSTVALVDPSVEPTLSQSSLSAFGHGTMVAGLIHLVASGARIMPLKAFSADGSASLSNIVRAIYYAVDHGAKVINMSFRLDTPSSELKAAIEYAFSRGVICLAAAGNSGASAVVYPAAYNYVIGVGSTNALDSRSAFSNFNSPSARTAAPGEGLITTYPGDAYAAVWGTSFSTALVSGAVAMIVDCKPDIRVNEVLHILAHGREIHQGMGEARLDVLLSMLELYGKDDE